MKCAADLVLLTVPDDAIRATASALAGFSGKAVIHTSGAHDASALAALAAARGAGRQPASGLSVCRRGARD